MESSESGAAPHRFNFAAVVSVGLLLIVWQVASFFLPEFIVPGLQLIGLEFVKVFEDGTLVSDSLLTLVRVMLGLIGGFIFGGALGLLMGLARRSEDYLMPVINFVMGVPALSWTLIVILWFRGTETRIFALMLAVSFPVFAHSLLDADFGYFRGRLAAVFQTDRLLPWRKALDNVAYGLEILRVPEPDRRARTGLVGKSRLGWFRECLPASAFRRYAAAGRHCPGIL